MLSSRPRKSTPRHVPESLPTHLVVKNLYGETVERDVLRNDGEFVPWRERIKRRVRYERTAEKRAGVIREAVGGGWSMVARHPSACTEAQHLVVALWLGLYLNEEPVVRPNGYPAGRGFGVVRRELHAIDPTRYRNRNGGIPGQQTVKGMFFAGLARKTWQFRKDNISGYTVTLNQVRAELERNIAD